MSSTDAAAEYVRRVKEAAVVLDSTYHDRPPSVHEAEAIAIHILAVEEARDEYLKALEEDTDA